MEASARCACFFCLGEFGPTDITLWVDGGDTAICPRCSVDSVLPEAAGFPLTPVFLQAMHQRWFEG